MKSVLIAIVLGSVAAIAAASSSAAPVPAPAPGVSSPAVPPTNFCPRGWIDCVDHCIRSGVCD